MPRLQGPLEARSFDRLLARALGLQVRQRKRVAARLKLLLLPRVVEQLHRRKLEAQRAAQLAVGVAPRPPAALLVREHREAHRRPLVPIHDPIVVHEHTGGQIRAALVELVAEYRPATNGGSAEATDHLPVEQDRLDLLLPVGSIERLCERHATRHP